MESVFDVKHVELEGKTVRNRISHAIGTILGNIISCEEYTIIFG